MWDMKKITVMRFFTAILCISAFVTFVRPVRAEISKADAARRQMEASMQIGDFRQALSKGIEAERLYEEEGQVADRIRVYIQLSTSYQNLGQHEKGLEDLKIALDLTKKAGDDALEASVLSHLGNAYMLINRLDEAEVRLKEALGIAERQGDDSTKAAALNYSGNLHMLRKDYDKAAAAYREAMAVPEGPANRLLPALVSANYAEALLQGGEYEAAARAIRTSYAKLKDLANSHDKAYGLIHLAQTCRRLSTASSTFRSELGQLTVASLNKAASVSEDIDDHLAASYALGYLGQFYEVKGLYADAINFTRRAIFEVQQIDAPEALYRWQWQSGRLFRAKGDLDAAISSYRDAVRSLQSVRRELFADCRIYNGLSFETEVEPVYYQLADLLLKRSEPVEDHETVQRYYAEAQRTVELLNTAELQNYFQDACLTANSATMTDLGSLPPHSAVIYVIPLADRIELLLGLPTEIRRFTAKVDEATVAKEVRILRKRLEKRTTRQYLPHAQKVYDWLIRPLETELASRKIDTLAPSPWPHCTTDEISSSESLP
jgi:tetratricopeptide (TPR) repeat protein